MKTSYFAVTPVDNPGAVCISRGYPRFWGKGGLTYRKLAPGPWYRDVDEMEYRKLYAEQLDRLDVRQVWDELHQLTGGAEPVLLCYEKSGEFCHRRLVAEWVERELGMEVPEIGRVSDTEQMELFAGG